MLGGNLQLFCHGVNLVEKIIGNDRLQKGKKPRRGLLPAAFLDPPSCISYFFKKKEDS